MSNKDMIISKEEQNKAHLTDKNAINKGQVEDGVKSSVKTSTSLMDELETDEFDRYVPVSNNSNKIQYDVLNSEEIPVNSSGVSSESVNYTKTDVSGSIKATDNTPSNTSRIFEKQTKAVQREYAQEQRESGSAYSDSSYSSEYDYTPAPRQEAYTQEVSSSTASQSFVNSEAQARSMVSDGGNSELVHSGSNTDNIRSADYNSALTNSRESAERTSDSSNDRFAKSVKDNRKKVSHNENTFQQQGGQAVYNNSSAVTADAQHQAETMQERTSGSNDRFAKSVKDNRKKVSHNENTFQQSGRAEYGSSASGTATPQKAALNAQEKYSKMVNETSNADFVHDRVKESVTVSEENSLISAVDTNKAERDMLTGQTASQTTAASKEASAYSKPHGVSFRSEFRKASKEKNVSHDETTFSVKTTTEKTKDNISDGYLNSAINVYTDEREMNNSSSLIGYTDENRAKAQPIVTENAQNTLINPSKKEDIPKSKKKAKRKGLRIKSSHGETTFNQNGRSNSYGNGLITYKDEKEPPKSSMDLSASDVIKSLPINTNEDFGETVIPVDGTIAKTLISKAVFSNDPKQNYDLLKLGAANARDEFRMAKLDVQMTKLDIEKAEKELALLKAKSVKGDFTVEEIKAKEAELVKMKSSLEKKQLTFKKKRMAYKVKQEKFDKFAHGEKGKTISQSKAKQAAKKLGIKQQSDVTKSIKDMILPTVVEGAKQGLVYVGNSFENVADKGINFTKTALMSSLYAAAEETPEAEGIKQMINVGKGAGKATTAVSKSYKSVKQGIQELKRLQNKLRLRKQVKAAAKKTGKKLGSGVAGMIKNAFKGATSGAKTAVIGIIGYLLLMTAAAGMIFGFILTFIWNTKQIMDTTEISKIIHKLDYKQQQLLYKYGKDHFEIIKDSIDSHSSDGSEYNIQHYVYLFAEDVPLEEDDSYPSTTNTKTNFNLNVTKYGSGYDDSYTPNYNASKWKIFYSKDEVLEKYRWTTDDIISAMAYLQVVEENLTGLQKLNILGITEGHLRDKLEALHEATYSQPMWYAVKEKNSDGSIYTYNYYKINSYPLTDVRTTGDKKCNTYHYYFFRKDSVDFLIQNDIIRLSDDDERNEQLKDRYEQVKKYGNMFVSYLEPPIKYDDREDLENRICKHFGDQDILVFSSEEMDITAEEDNGDRISKNGMKKHYGKYKKFGSKSYLTTHHNAIDFEMGDDEEHQKVYAPISGICKCTARWGRGYEFVISNSYKDGDFNFEGNGICVKLSCINVKDPSIPYDTPFMVKQGQELGVCSEKDFSVNHCIPDEANTTPPDEPNDTYYANFNGDTTFPCFSLTELYTIGYDETEIPSATAPHIHLELYQLPCDFTSTVDIKRNTLDPELHLKYPES